MLGRVVFFAVVLSAIAVSAPQLAPGLLSAAFRTGDGPAAADQAPAARAVQPLPPDDSRDDSRHVTLSANPEGHFVAEATIDGGSVVVMVDTGATLVALRDTTARHLGIYPAQSDYSERLSTANGVVMAARVTLYEVRLGSLVLRDVPAVIVPGEALPVDLLGLSFLSRLSKYEFTGRQLVLSQ